MARKDPVLSFGQALFGQPNNAAQQASTVLQLQPGGGVSPVSLGPGASQGAVSPLLIAQQQAAQRAAQQQAQQASVQSAQQVQQKNLQQSILAGQSMPLPLGPDFVSRLTQLSKAATGEAPEGANPAVAANIKALNPGKDQHAINARNNTYGAIAKGADPWEVLKQAGVNYDTSGAHNLDPNDAKTKAAVLLLHHAGIDPMNVVIRKLAPLPDYQNIKEEVGGNTDPRAIQAATDKFYRDYTDALVGALQNGDTDIKTAKKSAIDQVVPHTDPTVLQLVRNQQLGFQSQDKAALQSEQENQQLQAQMKQQSENPLHLPGIVNKLVGYAPFAGPLGGIAASLTGEAENLARIKVSGEQQKSATDLSKQQGELAAQATVALRGGDKKRANSLLAQARAIQPEIDKEQALQQSSLDGAQGGAAGFLNMVAPAAFGRLSKSVPASLLAGSKATVADLGRNFARGTANYVGRTALKAPALLAGGGALNVAQGLVAGQGSVPSNFIQGVKAAAPLIPLGGVFRTPQIEHGVSPLAAEELSSAIKEANRSIEPFKTSSATDRILAGKVESPIVDTKPGTYASKASWINPSEVRGVNNGTMVVPGVKPDPNSPAFLRANLSDTQAGLDIKSQKSGEPTADVAVQQAKQNPKFGTVKDFTPVKEGDWKQAILNPRARLAFLTDYHNSAVKAMVSLSPKDLALIDSLRGANLEEVSKSAEHSKKFLDAARKIKYYNDYSHAVESYYRMQRGMAPLPYRQDYGLRMKLATQKTGPLDIITQAGLQDRPGYGLRRGFKNYAEAAAAGVPRKNLNAIQDLNHDFIERAHNIGSAEMQRSMQQAFPGKVSEGVTPTEGRQLTVPYGTHLSLTSDLAGVAEDINSRGTAKHMGEADSRNPNLKRYFTRGDKKMGYSKKELLGKPMAVYDAANHTIKYVQLGGGLFHGVTTLGTAGGQRIIAGAKLAVTHPTRLPSYFANTGRAIAGTFSRQAHDANMRKWEADGSLDFNRQVGTTLRAEDILADMSPLISKESGVQDAAKTSMRVFQDSRLNFIKNAHDLVFDRQIPEAKIIGVNEGMKAKFGAGFDPKNPTQEQIVYGRKLASAWNNLGGINRLVEGTTPNQLKWLGRGWLATDFTEGKIRTLYNAARRWGPENPQGRIAREMIIGKSLLYAMPGLVQAYMTGHIKSLQDLEKEAKNQLFDPSLKTGFKTKGGFPKIVKLPKTFLSEPAELFKSTVNTTDSGEPSVDQFGGLKHYFGARMAALPSAAEQLATNQSYSGDPLIARNEKGKVDIGKSLLNTAAAKAPIPIAQGIKASKGNQTWAEALINTLGGHVVADPNSEKMKQLQSVQRQDAENLKGLARHVGDVVNGQKITTVSEANRITRQFQGAYNVLRTESVEGGNVWKPTAIAALSEMLLHGGQAGQQVIDSVRAYAKTQDKHDPLWDLSPERFNQVNIKQFIDTGTDKTPGDKAFTEALYKAPWYNQFLKDRSAYFSQIPQSGNTPWLAVPRQLAPPTQPDSMQQYNPDASGADKRAFFQAHPEASNYLRFSSNANVNQSASMGLPASMTGGQIDALSQFQGLKQGGVGPGQSMTGRAASSFIKSHPELEAYFNLTKAEKAQAAYLGGGKPSGSSSNGFYKKGGRGRRGRRGGGSASKFGSAASKKVVSRMRSSQRAGLRRMKSSPPKILGLPRIRPGSVTGLPFMSTTTPRPVDTTAQNVGQMHTALSQILNSITPSKSIIPDFANVTNPQQNQRIISGNPLFYTLPTGKKKKVRA